MPLRVLVRRLACGVGVAAIAIGAQVAYGVVKNDVFSDVPSTAVDHDAINRVYDAGIMKPCATSPSLQFCPNQTTIRRGIAKQYDYALGLAGTPGAFTPSFRAVNVVTGGAAPPLTVDSTQKVVNLNVDEVDGIDGANISQGISGDDGYVASGEQTFFNRFFLQFRGAVHQVMTVPGFGALRLNCGSPTGIGLDFISFPGSPNFDVFDRWTRPANGGDLTTTAVNVIGNGSSLNFGGTGDWNLELQGGTGYNTAGGQKLFDVDIFVTENYGATGKCFFEGKGSVHTT